MTAEQIAAVLLVACVLALILVVAPVLNRFFLSEERGPEPTRSSPSGQIDGARNVAGERNREDRQNQIHVEVAERRDGRQSAALFISPTVGKNAPRKSSLPPQGSVQP